MPLNGATVLEGTTVSSTGGTSKTYSTDGLLVNNGIHLIDASVTDFRTQPSMTVKNTPAKLSSDETWSNFKREVVHTRPKVLTNGKQKFPNIRITLTGCSESSQAEVDELCKIGAQMLTDADFLAYWRTGSLS